MSKEKLVPKLRFEEFKEHKDWENIKLGDVADIVGGGTPSTQIKTYWNGDINWFSPTEVGKVPYVDSSERKITKLGFQKSSTTMLPIGTILFTSRAGIGKTAILAKESTTNQGFQSIVPKKTKLDSYFIYSRSQEIKNYAEQVGAGSTFVEVSGKQLEKMSILIPDLVEQQKIGSFFEQIDEMIQLQQSKVNKIKDIKSAYLSEMFPKEGEKYPKKRFEGFVEPWSITKFSDIADVQRGLTYHPSNIVENGGVRVLRSSNIDEDTFVIKDDDIFVNEGAINIDLAQKQDILITSANGSPRLVGKHAILEKLETQSVHGGFMLLARTDNSYFLNASMSSDWYKKFINYHVAGGGGSIGNIKKSDLENQLIYIPSKEEQRKIGNFFKNLDNQISIEEEKLAKLEKLKQAYLNDMFV